MNNNQRNHHHPLLITLLLCLMILADFGRIASQAGAGAFSIKQEREIGEQMLAMARKEFQLINEPDLNQYLDRLGRELSEAARSPYFDFRFFLLNNKEFNAFAAPSGLIFIHTGLINSVTTEDQLMSVLAHEGAHVTRRHLASQVEKSSKINVGTIALILAGIAMGAGPLSEAVIAGSLATSNSLALKFSRDHEEEADRLAYDWLKEMGRDPKGMLDMLSRMRKAAIMRMGQVPQYLLTHPDPARRMNYVQDLILADSGQKNSSAAKDDFAFQRFRYKVMVLSREADKLLPVLTKKINSTAREDFMARYGLALLYRIRGNYPLAHKFLQEVIDQYPDQAILTADLGLISLKEGRIEEAIELFNRAFQKDPADHFSHFHLAEALLQAGHREAALPHLTRLLTEIPDYPRLHYLAARTRAGMGDKGLSQYHLGIKSWLEGDFRAAKNHLITARGLLPQESPQRVRLKETLAKINRLEKQPAR